MNRFGLLPDAQARYSVAQARYSVAQARHSFAQARRPILVAATDNGCPRPARFAPRFSYRCPAPDGSPMRLRPPSGGHNNSSER